MFGRKSVQRNEVPPRSSSRHFSKKSRPLSLGTPAKPARMLVMSSTCASVQSLPMADPSARPSFAVDPIESTVEEPMDSEPLFQDHFISSPYEAYDTVIPMPSISEVPHLPPFHLPQQKWENNEDDIDDPTLEDLAARISFYDSDIATTVVIARAGKPKMVDVSPATSVKSRSSMSSRRDLASNHSRSSSYFAPSISRSNSVSSYYGSGASSASVTSPATPLTPASNFSRPFPSSSPNQNPSPNNTTFFFSERSSYAHDSQDMTPPRSVGAPSAKRRPADLNCAARPSAARKASAVWFKR